MNYFFYSKTSLTQTTHGPEKMSLQRDFVYIQFRQQKWIMH